MKQSNWVEKDVIRQKEFVYPDSYAYVIRDKKTGKILVSKWSAEEAEEAFKQILNSLK